MHKMLLTGLTDDSEGQKVAKMAVLAWGGLLFGPLASSLRQSSIIFVLPQQLWLLPMTEHRKYL